MKTPIKKSYIAAVAFLALVSIATLSMTGGGDRGTVLSVHDAKMTAKFKATLGLPLGQEDGGRFAVVKIDNGAYGDASFALVYVPPQFSVSEDSVVQLNSKGINVLSHPGSAAVAKVFNGASAPRMTQFASNFHQILQKLSFGA